ncbi:hypothetical protein RQP46_001285 [Phenoliferia psychrophenolica]
MLDTYLSTRITTERKLAGILGLSGRVSMVAQLPKLQSQASKSLPVFWGHGSEDAMISLEKARSGVRTLEELGVAQLEFKTYPGMGHSTCQKEVLDIEAFLHKVLPPVFAFGAPPIVLGPRGKHTATIIFSHGLAGTAEDWRPFANSLIPLFPNVKFVLPTAPRRFVTVVGDRIHSWFNVKALGSPLPEQEDTEGMLAALKALDGLVQAEVNAGIPEERIVVGGFSQGCRLALLIAVMSERKLAGILGLSGMLMMVPKLESMQSEAAKSRPLFWGHGLDDVTNSLELARFGAKKLEGLGMAGLEFKTYPDMAHEICPQEMEDVVTFLKKILP